MKDQYFCGQFYGILTKKKFYSIDEGSKDYGLSLPQEFYISENFTTMSCVTISSLPKTHSPPPNKTSKITIHIKDVKGVGDFIWSQS